MTLVMLGLFPIIGMSFGAQMAVVNGAAASAIEASNQAGALASQALLNIRTVAAFGLEAHVSENFAEKLDVPLQQYIRKGCVTGAGMGFAQLVILGGAGLAYYVGGKLIAINQLTFPNLMVVILCIMFGAVGLGQVAADASDKAEAINAARNISKLWSTETTISVTGGLHPEETNTFVKGKVSVKNAFFAYPSRPDHNVYNGLSLEIEPGTTVALVGPSGCGKSSLVALLERFYNLDAGSIELDGEDISTLNVAWLRSQIGLVSQEPVLFSGSIFDNIKYGKDDATKEEVEQAARQANAHTFIAGFPDGYDTQVGERGIQLSGGQKQRIAIARAIVRNPHILILDEATSALDTTSERIVQEALDSLLREKRRTTIVIAHRLSTIRNADKIIVLENGALREQGTYNELLSTQGSLFATLVKMQESSSSLSAGQSVYSPRTRGNSRYTHFCLVSFYHSSPRLFLLTLYVERNSLFYSILFYSILFYSILFHLLFFS